jgi:hypothetical protein
LDVDPTPRRTVLFCVHWQTVLICRRFSRTWLPFIARLWYSIYYLWTQGNVRLPSGLIIVQLIRVCILAMGMPRFQAALCMTWPFLILCELFCMWPAKVTTWCVRTQSKTGVPYSGLDPPPVHPTPGTFGHMDAHPDTSGSSSFRAFREVWDTAAEPIQICADELSCESKIYHC